MAMYSIADLVDLVSHQSAICIKFNEQTHNIDVMEIYENGVVTPIVSAPVTQFIEKVDVLFDQIESAFDNIYEQNSSKEDEKCHNAVIRIMRKHFNPEPFSQVVFECNIMTTDGFVFGAKTISDAEER